MCKSTNRAIGRREASSTLRVRGAISNPRFGQEMLTAGTFTKNVRPALDRLKISDLIGRHSDRHPPALLLYARGNNPLWGVEIIHGWVGSDSNSCFGMGLTPGPSLNHTRLITERKIT
jgi:hypothetical protein